MAEPVATYASLTSDAFRVQCLADIARKCAVEELVDAGTLSYLLDVVVEKAEKLHDDLSSLHLAQWRLQMRVTDNAMGASHD